MNKYTTKSGRPLTLGLGTGSKWKDYKREKQLAFSSELVDLLKNAIEAGVRHIDTAYVYNTQTEVGIAIKESGIRREDMWITTKYFHSRVGPSKRPLEVIDEILTQLQTDYLDLLLIHHPFVDKNSETSISIEEMWREFNQLKTQGKVREIGVSNFGVADLKKLSSAEFAFKPAFNQIEFHPSLQNQSPGVVKFSQDNGILVEAYGSLTPLGFEKGQLLEYLEELSSQLNRTKAQILLRYTLQKGILPITTTKNSERIKQNFEIYDFKLDDGQIERIDELGALQEHREYFTKDFEHYSSLV
ncbi:Piso0_005019 [Millerozyma farinosa CBS 7064]|uniref:2-dehydropantolactone reductase n=1 Tax=Pichia sorbitophila (strain ATCC MYA-4447 / BCRC 22081 / CBS 7064 / NBRC 10061 / NRRL Y-12695) TaxID=559304 RepID=G8Y121_PICSO|nr:Piso0_005019 [Millerozyma farinosa CBS 7064]